MRHIPLSIGRIPLVRGAFRVLLTAYVKIFKRRYMIESRLGLRLLLDHENIIDWQVYISGQWEGPQIGELFELVAEQLRRRKADAIFFDIGAHWGLYALLAHRSALFEKIVAFEPDLISFGQLEANIVLNEAHGAIEPVPLAATSVERDFALLAGPAHNRGATKVIEPDVTTPATCHGVALDARYKFEGKLLVVKIDVEGHELEVIEGMRSLLVNNRCVVQVEIMEEPIEESIRRFKYLSSVFAANGIRFVRAINADFFFVSDFPHNKPSATGLADGQSRLGITFNG
jgi:FkbM family methyltransferase